jgi:Ca2+-transporting ATPase
MSLHLYNSNRKFVKGMAIIGIVIFLLVWEYYYKTQDILNSLLKGLTLAMSILPRKYQLPYHFYVLGSWRLMKESIIVKKKSEL